MESTALQQAFDTCQNNKAAWLQRKNELAAAEQEYLRLLSGEGRNVSRLDELRNIIEVRKWQVNQAAGRYIRSHEAVQHISIRDRLNDFMQPLPETVPYSVPQMPCVKPFCPGLRRGKKLIIPHRIATF